jgi:hypothetical protein
VPDQDSRFDFQAFTNLNSHEWRRYSCVYCGGGEALEFLCVFVDQAGRPAGGKTFCAPTMDEAIAIAKVLADRRRSAGYEIWQAATRTAAAGVALEL